MKRFISAITMLLLFSLGATAQWDKDVFSYRGRLALQDGRYANAIENFNILARLDTTDYWTYFYRGIAKYNLGDLRGAQADFNNSVRLNPVFTNGYHYRAITRSRFGNYEEALADLQRAIDLRPGFDGLYYSRGVTYFLSQDFESAITDFNRYILHEPSDPSAYLNRGACHLFTGDTLKALADYNKAIKLDRFEAEGYIRRARLYAGQDNYTDAIEDLNKAVSLDTTNTYALFNRALLLFDTNRYRDAMADLNAVLRYEPGNALTLYNRSLISAQMGDYAAALDDMDRVLNINPRNVLAYYNRASYFVEMQRWRDALADYDTAIELYPDFAKAYMNRAYVENMLGMNRQSKADYETAQRKIRDYQARTRAASANESGKQAAGGKTEADASSSDFSMADTTRKYSSLLALDADFASKDFDDELLQHRDVDIRLKPLYKFSPVASRATGKLILGRYYENALISRFEDGLPVAVDLCNTEDGTVDRISTLAGYDQSRSGILFCKGLWEVRARKYNAALRWFDAAVAAAETESEHDAYARFYKAFYLMNRGALKAEMTDFIASMESNVQTLSMDDRGAARTRVSDGTTRSYDYSEAIADMQAAAELVPDIPYIYFNLGNLYCLSSEFVGALEGYDKAIELYPYMGDAYYNRGLVLIYLKDREKGCIDLSRAGELGVADAYSVIKRYCEQDD